MLSIPQIVLNLAHNPERLYNENVVLRRPIYWTI